MQAFQNILKFLNTQSNNTPRYLGVFHIIWIAIAIAAAVTLCVLWKKEVIKKVSNVILIASIVLLCLGLYKQVVLSFSYEPEVVFNYNFNNFPWHFLSVPLIVGIFVGATSGSIKKNFLSYYATFGLLAGLWGLFQPNAFVSTIGLNVYAMLCYSTITALSVLVLVSQEVNLEFKTYFKSLPVFAMMFGIAISFNEIFHLVVSNQHVSMFSVSRHMMSDVAGYSWLHNFFYSTGDGITWLEYTVCILFYFALVSLVALVPFALIIGMKKLLTTDFDVEYAKNDDLALGLRKSEGLDEKENQEVFTFGKKVNSKKNSYMKTYFENLHTNFGNNLKGSCGYVALSMLLSYYDTVLNEKIVPRQFDEPSLAHDAPDFKNSPGTKFYQPAFDPSQVSYKDYIKDINKRKNFYLHECLLNIGMRKDFVKEPDDKNAPVSDNFFGIDGVNSLKKLTKYYLKNIAGVKGTEYDIHTKTTADVTGADIRNYVIRKIKKGYPVVVGISNNSNEGHVVVAYDYDKKSDEIYFHYGYKSEDFKVVDLDGNYVEKHKDISTHLTLKDGGYDSLYFALVLDFDERKISRTHTDNYEVVINGALFYYCLDGRYTTPDDLVVEFGVGKNELSIIGVYHKYSKEKLTIPEYIGNVKVTNFGKGAFKNQKIIQQVVLSCEVPALSKKMFEDCTFLKTVILPTSIKKINRKAFNDCRSLTTIMYLGTKEEWNAIKKCGSWDKKTGNYRVYCTDGVLTKKLANGQSELL